MNTREAINIPSFDDGMDDFEPRGAGQGAQVPPAEQTKRSVDAVSQFPSREAPADAQLNLKGPRDILDRFRKMCKDDRRTYYDMLEILMDRFDGKTP
jgi:hypothetical protein